MTVISPQTVYDNLNRLEQEDVVESAVYRELAQAALADPDVSLNWRQAIAERLSQANHLLAMLTVGKDDSY
jgi:Fe2+ or Zn2+ uptake regulation protein